MTKRVTAGTKFGYLRVIRVLKSSRAAKKKNTIAGKRRAVMVCEAPKKWHLDPETGGGVPEFVKKPSDRCGKEVTLPLFYMTRANNPRTDCGCVRKKLAALGVLGYGWSRLHEQEYRLWMMMHQRIDSPKHPSYKHYKERGITIADVFHKDRNPEGAQAAFTAWFNEVGKRPSKNFSLDRLDNCRGYEPGNIMWCNKAEQLKNRGDRVCGLNRAEAATTMKEHNIKTLPALQRWIRKNRKTKK